MEEAWGRLYGRSEVRFLDYRIIEFELACRTGLSLAI